MSWSGPVAGAASYQQPQYPAVQPAFAHPPTYQYGQQSPYTQIPGAHSFPSQNASSRPPEIRAPKKKGNPIITRYPPPPGYRGPARPPPAFGSQQRSHHYSQSQPSYQKPGPPTNPAYPAPGYQPPPVHGHQPLGYGHVPNAPQNGHPSPGFPPSPYPWPQQQPQGYTQHPNQSFTHQPSHPGAQSYTRSLSYPGHTVQAPPVNPNQQSWGHTQGWQQPNPSTNNPLNSKPGSFSSSTSSLQFTTDPHATPTQTSIYPTTSQPVSSTSQPSAAKNLPLSGNKNQIFSASDEWDFEFEGAIWPKANEPVDPNFSLGVTIWRPAKQVTRALPSSFSDAEEQALKPPPEKLGNGESVSIYFTAENSHEAFLNVRQTDEWYRIRKDPVFVVFNDEEMASNLIPIEECLAMRDRPDEPTEALADEDDEMHDAVWNVMDNLEQALSESTGDDRGSITQRQNDLAKDQNQEDVLARLGVTGMPKPPSHEPFVVPLSPVPKGVETLSSHIPSSSSVDYNPWNPPTTSSRVVRASTQDCLRGSPARSENSSQTAVEPDHESEELHTRDTEIFTAVALGQNNHFVTRKRSHNDTDQEGQKQQANDNIKRKRLSQGDFSYR
ncbi:unnamed protein product [Periconia digitata]|uniref:Uncharacterized protein n=1 Tax=Periconia digitata TaxID=1303443 RepID=A0A9W4U4G9_9PLEO|nr:unnamed protein product [Periconia digitata]